MSEERKVDEREEPQVEDLELAKSDTEGVKGGADLTAADGQSEYKLKNVMIKSWS